MYNFGCNGIFGYNALIILLIFRFGENVCLYFMLAESWKFLRNFVQ